MPAPRLTVAVPRDVAPARTYRFASDFRIGRDPSCDIHILHGPSVSMVHARVVPLGDTWWVIDLNSTHATFLGRKRVSQLAIEGQTPVRLGQRGPVLVLTPELEPAEAAPDRSPIQASLARLRRRTARWWTWFAEHAQEIVHDLRGQSTDATAARTPYEHAQARRRRWFVASLGVLAFLLLTAGTYTAIQQARIAAQERELAQHRENARTLFYSLRAVEVDLMTLTEALDVVTDPNVLNPVMRVREQRQQNMERYEAYVERLGLYDNLEPDVRLIHRTLSRFGEFSLDVPPAFVDSVRKQIRLWKVGSGYERAIHRARQAGLTRLIPEILAAHDLPPEFMYLALQESHLQPHRSGPPTRYGHAKGLWQFVPATARRYKLRTGPLSHLPAYDPDDERFDVEKSTEAAAKHLRGLYSNYVQASGLLVMASYNWGEQNILRLMADLPNTPQDRNFWKLLEAHGNRIPRETRNYVFRIVAAAVIGENPELFGFDFDNPLSDAPAAVAQSVAISTPRPTQQPISH